MFDIIIIGAGSAGCTLAGSLDKAYRICLIEVGGSDLKPQITIPLGMAITVPYATPQNWHFFTTPQAHLNNRRGYQPRGRGLGGSSSINAMVYIRGQAQDYDHWASLGCNGWAWRDVLPYFIKSENNEAFTGNLHGTSGELNVANSRSNNIFAQAFIDAGVEAGYTYNIDFNGTTQEGVGWYQVTQKNGERWNTARAFLHNNAYPNLNIRLNSHVKRVIFNFDSGRPKAIGVEVICNGKLETILAKKEVILCAGAFGSPQILLASGIGHADHLQQFGIPVIHHLPQVGENLQDHIDFIINKKVPFPQAINLLGISMRGTWRLLTQFRQYIKKRQGIITSNVAEAGGFLRSYPEATTPDIQLHFTVGMVKNHHLIYRHMHGYSCHVCVLKPKSRGNVRLASEDTKIPPVINPNFLSHPDDLATLIRGVKIMQKILNQPALSKFGGTCLHPAKELQNDEDIAEAIRNHADTIYHPVGTCRMGSDADAVVDTQLRVNGVSNLRIVDASIMPTIISGNTNGAVIMIAKRAADLINKAN